MSTCITIPEQTVSIPSQEVCFTVNAPTIVYQNSWLNQNSVIDAMDIFTPLTNGIFRVTAVVFVTNSTNGQVIGSFYYPGAGGANFSSSFNNENSPALQNVPASLLIGGTPNVPVHIFSTSPSEGIVYDLFVTIEQLQ